MLAFDYFELGKNRVVSSKVGDELRGADFKSWSRRRDLNTPPADYYSAALPLSYTGSLW
jgi:hypothetical protein